MIEAREKVEESKKRKIEESAKKRLDGKAERERINELYNQELTKVKKK